MSVDIDPVSGKPWVDPNCLCGKAAPCPDHNRWAHTDYRPPPAPAPPVTVDELMPLFAAIERAIYRTRARKEPPHGLVERR